MATMIINDSFIRKIDSIDDKIDKLMGKKAKFLLTQLGLTDPLYYEKLKEHETLVFAVPNRGLSRQLNRYCDDKSRLRFDYVPGRRQLFTLVPDADARARDRWVERKARMSRV